MSITKEKREAFMDWAEKYLIPINSINPKFDTSAIRLSFERGYKYGFYIDNYTVNDILLSLGFKATNLTQEPYYHWNISSASPGIRLYRQWERDHQKSEKYE